MEGWMLEKAKEKGNIFPVEMPPFGSLYYLYGTPVTHTEGTISNFRLQVKNKTKKQKHAHWACTRKGLLLRPHLITFQ
jgi:hypothetical protein